MNHPWKKLCLCIALLCFLALPAVHVSAKKSKASGEKAHWGYQGKTGPQYWGDIQPEFSTCKSGKMQSPINIEPKELKKVSRKELQLNYNPATLDLINNGHTVQLNYTQGSSMKVRKKTFNLLQLHFHSPSEHTVNGVNYEMEIHLVHQSKDGPIAVVGLLVEQGNPNPELGKLLNNLPRRKGNHKINASVKIDPMKFIPENPSFYHYKGSLTTPPCSQNVSWYVIQEPVHLSAKQIKKFKKLYHGNNRPVQALNKRSVSKN